MLRNDDFSVRLVSDSRAKRIIEVLNVKFEGFVGKAIVKEEEQDSKNVEEE